MTGPRIPETDGVSGTWTALERTSPIVQQTEGVPTTTSMRIANGTHNEHASVLRLIRDNLADFEEFGGVGFEIAPFETAGGMQRREIAILNEEHATLLLTYMRNNDVVKDFKKRLVREFSALRHQVMNRESNFMIPQTLSEALRLAADEHDRAEVAESRVRELTPSASAWNELADAAGDYSVADASKVLSRDPAITIGQNRLFAHMKRLGWIYRRDGRWRAMQTQVDLGRLTEKLGKPYVREGQMCVGDPSVRITAKGIRELHRRLGGTGQLELMASVS